MIADVGIRTWSAGFTRKEAKTLRTGYKQGCGFVSVDSQVREAVGEMEYVGCYLMDDGANEDEVSVVFIACGKQHADITADIYRTFTNGH